MTFPEPFHGPHVGPLAAEKLGIEWREPAQRCTRIRVKKHTGECGETLYELCQAGGLWFIRRTIRRTIRKASRTMVSETIWMSPAEVELLWAGLLAGRAC